MKGQETKINGDKDIKLLSELLQDADRSQKTLSAAIGITESELTRRKQKMKESGIIRKYTIDIDYSKVGYNTVGYFMFSEKDKSAESSDDVVKFLMDIEEIIEINEVFGRDLDFVLKIMCRDNNHFLDVVGKIRNHANVRSEGSFSAIVGKTSKQEQGAPIVGS
jgi:DNA-binding Lrp family transcriptional regulator